MLQGDRKLIFKDRLKDEINEDAYLALKAHNSLLCKRGWVSQLIKRMLQQISRNMLEFIKDHMAQYQQVNLQQILIHTMRRSATNMEILKMTEAVPRETFQYKLNMSLWEKILEFLGSFRNLDIFGYLTFLWDKIWGIERKASSKDNSSLFQKQTFFLDPNFHNKSYIIPPSSSITLDALIYQPSQESRKDKNETLYIKNNLTVLYEVPLRGESGMGFILFTKMKYTSDNQLIESHKV